MRHEAGPNLFLIGAPRGGTTMLYGCLAGHPDVFAPTEKEPQHHLFAGGRGQDLYCFRNGRRIAATAVCNYVAPEAYAALYRKGREARYRMDGSTLYWAHAHVARSLAAAAPDARLIVVLRDPVARAVSHHRFNQARGEEPLGLLAALRDELAGRRRGWWLGGYLHCSRYRERLEPFRRAFGRDRICVLDFAELTADGEGVLARLAAFLDLRPGFGPLRPSNEARSFAHPAAAWLRRQAVRAKQVLPVLASVPGAVEGVRWLERRYGRTPPAPDQEALALLEAELGPHRVTAAVTRDPSCAIWPGPLRADG